MIKLLLFVDVWQKTGKSNENCMTCVWLNFEIESPMGFVNIDLNINVCGN